MILQEKPHLTHLCHIRQLMVLRGLLTSSDVELRITAGETMALILESAYEHDEVIIFL